MRVEGGNRVYRETLTVDVPIAGVPGKEEWDPVGLQIVGQLLK